MAADWNTSSHAYALATGAGGVWYCDVVELVQYADGSVNPSPGALASDPTCWFWLPVQTIGTFTVQALSSSLMDIGVGVTNAGGTGTVAYYSGKNLAVTGLTAVTGGPNQTATTWLQTFAPGGYTIAHRVLKLRVHYVYPGA